MTPPALRAGEGKCCNTFDDTAWSARPGPCQQPVTGCFELSIRNPRQGSPAMPAKQTPHTSMFAAVLALPCPRASGASSVFPVGPAGLSTGQAWSRRSEKHMKSFSDVAQLLRLLGKGLFVVYILLGSEIFPQEDMRGGGVLPSRCVVSFQVNSPTTPSLCP